jgi:hypothetical protein
MIRLEDMMEYKIIFFKTHNNLILMRHQNEITSINEQNTVNNQTCSALTEYTKTLLINKIIN